MENKIKAIEELKNTMKIKNYELFEKIFNIISQDKETLNILQEDKKFNKELPYFILPMYLKEEYKTFIENNRMLFLALQHWHSYLRAIKTASGKGYSTAPKEAGYRGGCSSGQFFQWW